METQTHLQRTPVLTCLRDSHWQKEIMEETELDTQLTRFSPLKAAHGQRPHCVNGVSASVNVV